MTEKFSQFNLEEPRDIDLDFVDAKIAEERKNDERVRSDTADKLIEESAIELHRKQMEAGLNEVEAISKRREEEVAEAKRKAEIEALHAEAFDDDLAWTEARNELHREAINEDAERTATYEDERASALRAKAFYDMDPKRIERQKDVVRWAKESATKTEDPGGYDEQVAILERMEASTRSADASRFVERMWRGTMEDHKAAARKFSQSIQNAKSTENILRIIGEWGGIPAPEGKFVTNDRFQRNIEEILANPDEKARNSDLQKLVKNKEVTHKLEEVREFEKQHMRNAEANLREEKMDAHDVIDVGNSRLFQLSPFLFGLVSSKNRKDLTTLKSMGLSYDTPHERRTIAVGGAFRLQHAREEARRVNATKLSRGMRSTSLAKRTIGEQTGIIAVNKRLVKTPKPEFISDGSPRGDRRRGFFSRFFSRFF